MIRTLIFLSALAMAAVAAPFKLGGQGGLGLTQPVMGSEFSNSTSSVGLGMSAGLVAEYDVVPALGLQGGVSYALQTWGRKVHSSHTSGTTAIQMDSTEAITQMNLEFSIGPTFHWGRLSASVGYRWSLPVTGNVDDTVRLSIDTLLAWNGSVDKNIQWAGKHPDTTSHLFDAMSTHNIYVQCGFEVLPHLTVGLDITMGLTGFLTLSSADGSRNVGDRPRSRNILTNRYILNARYDFL